MSMEDTNFTVKTLLDRSFELNNSRLLNFIPRENYSYGSSNTVIRICLVLLLRAGYLLVQLGSVPVENIYIIVLQNIVDIAVSIASFGLIGFVLAFGDDSLDGFAGHGMKLETNPQELDNIILGFCACIIATGIISTMLSGRLHFVGYLLISILLSMVCLPLIMHWIWDDKGWMHYNQFLKHTVSLKDHAGSLVVHYTGGLVGFIGSLFLGRRLMKLNDIDESSIGTESPGSTITGYIFIALGLIGFSLPTPSYELLHVPANNTALVLINNVMAMAAGIILVVILQILCYRETFNYWIILRCVQGAISGIVTIAAGVDVYIPIVAYGIASLGALIFYLTAICVNTSSIEDYCNVIAVHLMCGFVGILLPTFLGSAENLGSDIPSHIRIIHLGWQLVCLVAISGVLIAFFCIFFCFLLITGFLRNKNEDANHRRGVIAAKKGPNRCFLQRLFSLQPNTSYLEPGNLGKTVEEPDASVKSKSASKNEAKLTDQERQQMKKIIYFKSDGLTDEAEVLSKSPLQNSNEIRKSRFAYTLHKTIRNNSIEFEGNIGDTMLIGEETIEIEDGCFSNLNRSDVSSSFHELHRTKKFTNMLRTKCRTQNSGLKHIKKTIELMGLPRSGEYVAHDEKFDDGFITLKMPPLGREYASWSDASDSV